MLSLPVLRDWYGLGEPQKTFTVSELAMYRGLNGGPVYLGAKGIVFDVSGSTFYAPGSNYHIFTGYDASRALAKMSLDVKDLEKNLLAIPLCITPSSFSFDSLTIDLIVKIPSSTVTSISFLLKPASANSTSY